MRWTAVESAWGLWATWTVVSVVYVILEVALLHRSIRVDDSSFAVLQASCPFALVDSAISKVHLPEAISLIIAVVSFVYIPRHPVELTIAVFLICEVTACVAIGLHFVFMFAPGAFPIFKAFYEISVILSTVAPSINTIPLRFATDILAHVSIAIGKEISSLAML